MLTHVTAYGESSQILTISVFPVVLALDPIGRPDRLVGAVDRHAGGDEILVPVARLAAG